MWFVEGIVKNVRFPMFDMIAARFAEVRMPGLFSYRSKFLVPLADIIQHPYSADRAVILSKQWKDSL